MNNVLQFEKAVYICAYKLLFFTRASEFKCESKEAHFRRRNLFLAEGERERQCVNFIHEQWCVLKSARTRQKPGVRMPCRSLRYRKCVWVIVLLVKLQWTGPSHLDAKLSCVYMPDLCVRFIKLPVCSCVFVRRMACTTRMRTLWRCVRLSAKSMKTVQLSSPALKWVSVCVYTGR